MAESTWNKGFFHISNDFLLLSCANFTFLIVQKRGSEFITASSAYFGVKRYLMCFVILIQTFDNYVKIFSIFMLTMFSLFKVCLQLVCANNTSMIVLDWISDDVGAFVADFAELADFVDGVGFLFAREFDFVGQTFLKVMGTQRNVLGFVVYHIYDYI